jgi:hypothetical protein
VNVSRQAAKRAGETTGLRFENRILKRLVKLAEQGCWPVRTAERQFRRGCNQGQGDHHE